MLRSHHHYQLRAFVKPNLWDVYCVNGFIGSWVWILSFSWVWGWEETVIAGVVSYMLPCCGGGGAYKIPPIQSHFPPNPTPN